MNLSLLQKREIIKYSDDYPTLSQEKIAEHFSSKFKLNQKIGRSTVCELMKNRAKYESEEALNINQNKKKMQKIDNPLLEKCLMLWYSDLISNNIPISDEMFIEQAKKFGEMIGISVFQFKYSKGWLQKFKRRNNLTQRIIMPALYEI
jgi:hypothetical protein